MAKDIFPNIFPKLERKITINQLCEFRRPEWHQMASKHLIRRHTELLEKGFHLSLQGSLPFRMACPCFMHISTAYIRS